MSSVKIADLEGLLQLPVGSTITSYETDNLTAAFENYGSLILTLKVVIEEKGEQSTRNLVCKLYPVSEQWQEMFNINVTFKREVNFYTKIIPELQRFQEELNIPTEELLDIFPKCHGARLQATNDDQTKVEAALVLENLKLQGFTIGKRKEGFTREQIGVLIKQLAKFHAVPIALKLKKPKVFEEKLRQLLTKIKLYGSWHPQLLEIILKDMEGYFREVPEISHLTDQLTQQLRFCVQENIKDTIDEDIFNSIMHCDLWVNNIMVTSDPLGNFDKIRFVDFQLLEMGPGPMDLIFLILTSANLDLLPEYIDEGLSIYYEELIRVLKVHSCPIEEFTFSRFLDSVRKSTQKDMLHLLIMFRIIHLDESKIDPTDQSGRFPLEALGDDFYRKLKIFILECQKRDWLMD